LNLIFVAPGLKLAQVGRTTQEGWAG